MSGFDHEGDLRVEGNLGIGTPEPEIELEVNSGDSEIGSRLSVGSELNGSFLSLFSGDNNNPPHIGWKDGKKLRIISTDEIVDGVENDLITISVNGNVGLGVSDPTDKLEVDGNIKAASIDAGEILKNGEPLQLSLWNETGAGIKHNGTVEAAVLKSDSVKTKSIDVKEILQNGKPLKTSPWKETAGGLKFDGKVTAQNVDSNDVKTKSVNSNQYLLNGKPLATTPWEQGASGISYSKGRVGIKNKNPQAELDVKGAVKSTSLQADTLKIGNGSIFSGIQAGRARIGNSRNRFKRNAHVKFPTAFKSIPLVIATAKGANHPDTYALTTTSISKNGFNVNVLRMDAAVGWGQILHIDWIAIELAPAKFNVVFNNIMKVSTATINKKRSAQRRKRAVPR